MKDLITFSFNEKKVSFKLIDYEIFINSTDLAKIISEEKEIDYGLVRSTKWKRYLNLEKLGENLILRLSVKRKHSGSTTNTWISEYLIIDYLIWLNDSKLTDWIIDKLVYIKNSNINTTAFTKVDYENLTLFLEDNYKLFSLKKVSSFKDNFVYLINNEGLLVSISIMSILSKLWILKDFNTVINVLRILDKICINYIDVLQLKYLALSSLFQTINSDKKLVSYYRQKTYLMKDSNTGLTKIGKAIDPKYRERTLQSEKPTISLFAVCEDNVELELHNKFEDKRVRGEWFNLEDHELDKIMNQYPFKLI